jgi:hypothetical protein
LAHVRLGKDIVAFYKAGDDWVAARSGGVSTFSDQGPGANWWCLPAGPDYPDELCVINDHGNHFNWEASVDLPVAAFVAALASVDSAFRKVSQLVENVFMDLSLKATRLVIEALEHYRQYHDQRLQAEGLSEDDVSDLMNDRLYLNAIIRDLEDYRDALTRRTVVESK